MRDRKYADSSFSLFGQLPTCMYMETKNVEKICLSQDVHICHTIDLRYRSPDCLWVKPHECD